MQEADSADVMRGDLEAPGLSSCLTIRETPARLGRLEGADLHKKVPLMAQLAPGDIPALWSQTPALPQPGMCHIGTGAVAHALAASESPAQSKAKPEPPSQLGHIPPLSLTGLGPAWCRNKPAIWSWRGRVRNKTKRSQEQENNAGTFHAIPQVLAMPCLL